MARKRDVNKIAAELLKVRLDKNALTAHEKTLAAELKSHPDFKQQDVFILQPAVSVIVKDEELALAWTRENAPQLIKIDTAAARKLFERNMSIPDGFDTKITERLVEKSNTHEESDRADQ